MTRPFPFAILLLLAVPSLAADPPPRDEAAAALRKAAGYFREKVACRGGYGYSCSADLQRRWGEGEVSLDTILVQPPGTPTVGLAYLRAYAATGDSYYLDAAREAAFALVAGQLESGGWTQTIHFGPAKRLGKYRKADPDAAVVAAPGGSWNASSLDDGQTQSALEFLMRADEALQFKHTAIHEAVEYGLVALLKAQFANGAFPQVWTGPVADKPVKKASLPDYDWKTEGRVKNYWEYYTLNDNLAGSVSRTLITAHEVYKDAKYAAALEKLGDFLLLAQMPAPQPAWCQQYGYEMHPIWARKFEPPAITGSESQDVMRTLIRIAQHTGKSKYLDPIPDALAYLRKSRLPDGKLARFYELGTNKPLYMNAKYELTYDAADAPKHYGWKVSANLDAIEKSWRDAKAGKPAEARKPGAKELEPRVRRIIADMDEQGRWVSTFDGEKLTGQPKIENGFKYLSSEVFSRNIEMLSDYLAATK